MKKILTIILITSIMFLQCPVLAKDKIQIYGNINEEFTLSKDLPEEITFFTTEPSVINEELTIPENSTITVEVINAQKELRWHKSGYILCKLKNYTSENEETVDLSPENIYLVARKYVPINKKDAAILSTEIVLTQAASIVGSCFIFFAPVDIAYFFTKGAIIKKKHPNWFKSGVMEAYDNSIFWFQLKGKPIELAEGDDLKLKSVSETKANKLNKKITKRQLKQAKKTEKKETKALKKQEKKEAKALKKEEKLQKKQERKEAKALKKEEKLQKKQSKKEAETPQKEENL